MGWASVRKPSHPAPRTCQAATQIATVASGSVSEGCRPSIIADRSSCLKCIITMNVHLVEISILSIACCFATLPEAEIDTTLNFRQTGRPGSCLKSKYVPRDTETEQNDSRTNSAITAHVCLAKLWNWTLEAGVRHLISYKMLNAVDFIGSAWTSTV
jgi:hypothetical protein